MLTFTHLFYLIFRDIIYAEFNRLKINPSNFIDMLKLNNCGVMMENDMILPQEIGSLKVVSLGFMIDDPDGAIIWRGPMKIGVIKQFLTDVEWGDLDYLVIDSPPGTGDEPLTVCQLLEGDKSAIIVTTPQQVAANDVIKSLNFCQQLEFPVLGIVENMSYVTCPDCGKEHKIFGESHIEAVRRIGCCELYAVADTNAELAKAKADYYGIEKCYSSVERRSLYHSG